MDQGILDRARAMGPRLIELRRTIHRHPELGFQEYDTAALVTETLRSLDIAVNTGLARTGVVGHMGTEGRIVALRADMDALPIQELNEVDYASTIPGVMHACGHDVHTTCLLGAAMLLKEAHLGGRVRLLFQPCEEGIDEEGKSGAMRIIEEGALDQVKAVFGLHTNNQHEVGTFACSPGPVAAAMDNFKITIRGKAAHGAYAYLGVDAILLAAQVATALHTIVSRRISGLDSGVISIGMIYGGTKENNLADEVVLRGTIRSFEPKVREKLISEMERACGIANALGGEAELVVQHAYPSMVNDPALTAFARQSAANLVGPEAVSEMKPEMGSEDFACYLEKIPGCYLLLGTHTPGQPLRPSHSPIFDVDESALPLGAALLAQLALGYLERR